MKVSSFTAPNLANTSWAFGQSAERRRHILPNVITHCATFALQLMGLTEA